MSSSLLVKIRSWNSGNPQATSKQLYSNFCQMCLNLSNPIASVSASMTLLQPAYSNILGSYVMLTEEMCGFFSFSF